MNFQQLRIIREAVQRNFNLTEVANAQSPTPGGGYTTFPTFLKSKGFKKVGVIGYSDSPGSLAWSKGFVTSAGKLGLDVVYENTSLSAAGTFNAMGTLSATGAGNRAMKAAMRAFRRVHGMSAMI